ncbi:MAG: Signal transduction histidine kinase [Ignavibacteria bacterium]|nr:Signal transduction histidine kinase [Ignavibacteria bacterium]
MEGETIYQAASTELPTVLIVENDVFSMELNKRVLRSICNIEVATDGKTAVEKATSKPYNLIIMDIELGLGINGMEATKQIRQINGYEKVPIIAVTAYATKAHKEEFLSGGCTHYLSKPINVSEMFILIKDLLNQSE